METLAQIVRSGKALYVGISNYDGVHMEKAATILKELHCPFIINQNRYSIFDRTIEKNGLKEAAVESGKGIIAFSPLAQGTLTNRYLNGIPEGSRASRAGTTIGGRYLTEDKLEKIRALNGIAADRGQSLAQMALCWVLRRKEVTSVLIGASSTAQLEDNVMSLNRMEFTADELQAIENILK